MRLTRIARAGIGAAALLAVSASVVLAHPLGNFTINHYAGIRVEPDRVLLDVVIDEAEIPAFQSTTGLDTDGDGRVSDAELAGLPVPRCVEVGRSLVLSVGGQRAPLTLTAAGATLPPGNGGLPTLRLVCGFSAAAEVASGTSVAFRDEFQSARIGWREVTAVGSGTTVQTPGVPSTSTSARLTAYPASLASAPDVRELVIDVRPGGPILPDLPVPDAGQVEPVTVDVGSAPAVGETVTGSNPAPAADQSPAEPAAAMPGGAEALPDVLRQAPVSPLLAVGAFLVAILLGAGHALTPGHGKTLMAAYLVGTRGTARHAVGLGLTVSVTHTAGILALAVVILAAESAFAPDLIVRVAPVIAAGSIVVVGSWMLVSELRRRRAEARREQEHEHAHAHDHGNAHGHDHAGAHDHDHPHDHETPHAQDDAHNHEAADPLEHRHGPIRHRHAPPADRPSLNWRGLALLGLAGGLVPSASALLILLGTIAAGRPVWGVVLVAAFGLGMAGVMTGIGLAVVLARGALDRAPRDLPLATVRRLVPLGASVVVLALGVVLSAQAIGAVRQG